MVLNGPIFGKHCLKELLKFTLKLLNFSSTLYLLVKQGNRIVYTSLVSSSRQEINPILIRKNLFVRMWPFLSGSSLFVWTRPFLSWSGLFCLDPTLFVRIRPFCPDPALFFVWSRPFLFVSGFFCLALPFLSGSDPFCPDPDLYTDKNIRTEFLLQY